MENVRRTLADHLVGRTVAAVEIRRPNVVVGDRTDVAMLVHARVAAVDRLGKQLALRATARDGAERCVCIHLGMTGSLWFTGADAPAPGAPIAPSPHDHVLWHVEQGGKLLFRDPRRFGGIWTFPSPADLHTQRWCRLGPDALCITPAALHQQLERTGRPIKAALLDQAVIAGLGNIYVDELLFASGIAPTRAAHTLTRAETAQLVRRMRRLLARAVRAGGTTFRSYSDANGQAGRFLLKLRVYGRAGQPCRQCGAPLMQTQVAGRTTVHCGVCQAAEGAEGSRNQGIKGKTKPARRRPQPGPSVS